MSLFDDLQPLFGKGQDLVPFAKGHGPGGAGLDAGGQHPGSDAVGAHVALGKGLFDLVIPGDIVRTGMDDICHVLLAELFDLVGHQHGTGLGILDHGAGHGHVGHVHADGRDAVAALVREKVPDHIALLVQMLVKTNDLVVVGVQIRRILMAPPLLGLVGGQIVPFLAGKLTAAACRAACGID